ncbi:ATPase [Aquicoccus sp. SCR17]|nr:ATPase [Carideicomes alvinocaridis]
MLYKTAQEWRDADRRKVVLFGMSGLGKTHLSNMLRADGDWFHYSIDYRIGTRYMGEYISDLYKREAMKVPLLRELLMTDSIYIGSNITFNNLAPLASYLGKPGDPEKGGLSFDEYMTRQRQHEEAETLALLDTPHFIDRSEGLYGYPHFVCDSGGSICELVDPANPDDAILRALADSALMVWLKGDEAHTEELVRRFSKAPKPMYYQPDFLVAKWQDYLRDKGVAEDRVDPDDFVRWTYSQALAHRQPRYAAMAEWGVTITPEDVARVKSPEDFIDLIGEAIDRQNQR